MSTYIVNAYLTFFMMYPLKETIIKINGLIIEFIAKTMTVIQIMRSIGYLGKNMDVT